MGKNYDRLSIEDFGKHLLDSEDLDPVYVALRRVDWPPDVLRRWMVAYWCYYHCGAASWLAQHSCDSFWKWMLVAAENKDPAPTEGRWPRGHERRHFRGVAAETAVLQLHRQYGHEPEAMVDYCAGDGGAFHMVADRVKKHRLFGPWISFKVADMVERVLDVPVDFSEAAVFMFKDPVRSALMLWRQRMGLPRSAEPKDKKRVIHEVVEHLSGVFGERLAPPAYDRRINLQEIETILCKWKSHMNGHYPRYNDIDDIRGGLENWREHSSLAREFDDAMPRRPQ